VTNLADSGPGSLRLAVLDANTNPGADVIDGASQLSGTIALRGGLLDIPAALGGGVILTVPAYSRAGPRAVPAKLDPREPHLPA
jgi:hypothetical protein